MIDIESDGAPKSNKNRNLISLEDSGEDEWMSDDNIDAKIGILRK